METNKAVNEEIDCKGKGVRPLEANRYGSKKIGGC